MKKTFLSLSRYHLAAPGLLLGFGLFFWGSASAQNLLKNGEFESQLGPTNWTVKYLHGGPDDFEIKDRTTAASRSWGSGNFGGHFRAYTRKLAHACFTQTVTNLVPGHLYTVSGYMQEDWWRSQDPVSLVYDPDGDGKRSRFLVYIEAIGGLGYPTVDGRIGTNAVNPEPVLTNADCAIYATDTIGWYTVKQTPDAEGKIEVRLHLDKLGWTTYDKYTVLNGYFDTVSLTY